MDYEELLDWALYAKVEPFGETRADYRIAMLTALTANINRDAKTRPEPFEVADFMPFVREMEEPEEANVEQEGATIHPETLAFLFGMARGQIANQATP